MAMPLDPGKHRVSARAPGKKEWISDVELGSAADQRQITVPLLSDATAAGAPPPVNPPGAAAGLTKPAGDQGTERAAGSGTWRRPLGYAVGGLGLVGIGVGVAFAVDRSSKLSDRSAICPGGIHCTVDDASRIDRLTEQARTSGQIATVGFVAGGVALAAGVVLILTAPTKPAASALTSVSIRVSRDTGATWLSAGGEW